MDVPFLLSEAQMRQIEPFFPLSHGVPRVDDRRIVSGIIYVIKHGLPLGLRRWMRLLSMLALSHASFLLLR
jgi:transposase